MNNSDKKVVALVGMPGSGKSVVARVFEEAAFPKVRFGDITDESVKKLGLPLNEANERTIREQLRKEHGMAAYALLNLPRIDTARQTANVIVDGLYSWEEYLVLKERYGDNLKVIAIWASPETRYQRLATRDIRPLTREQAVSRDHAEIEKSNKGGPIAMADYAISNESTVANLEKEARRVLSVIMS